MPDETGATMPDDLKVEPLAPIPVTIIGTGDGTPIPATGTIAQTEGAHVPNLVTNLVTPLMAISVRFANVYIGSLGGILASAMATDIIPATDFWNLFLKCASLALGGTVLLSLKDIGTVLSGLERRFPLLTGSV